MGQSIQKKAVVLLSGGLDSTTALAIARSRSFACYALTFRYGQRHQHEIRAARKIARQFRVAHHVIVDIDLRRWGGSALTGKLAVPKNRRLSRRDIPVTYVPARNMIFLSFAVAWAEALKARDIFIGVNALDYSGYPDCRPEFIRACEKMAALGTRTGVEGKRIRINTPLIRLSKAEIIKRGMRLGVDYASTHSCYDPRVTGTPCGHCDACRLRARGFREAGFADPALAN